MLEVGDLVSFKNDTYGFSPTDDVCIVTKAYKLDFVKLCRSEDHTDVVNLFRDNEIFIGVPLELLEKL
jgi:hypothetical protein